MYLHKLKALRQHKHTHMFIVFAIVCVDVSWMVANSPDT